MRQAVLFLGLVGALFAAQFWEKKPYQEWTEQEIARILIDSPWAKEVIIRLDKDYTPSIPPPPPPNSPGGVVAPGSNLGGGPLGNPAVGRKIQTLPAGATVRVRWESAEPLRQAIARTRGSSSVEGPTTYRLAIDNIPPYLESARFGSLQAELLANAILKVGKRTVIHPTDVSISANKAGLIVRLDFPRDAAIVERDGEVVLETEAGVSGIVCSFRLRDMFYGGKLAL
jgi:hypothetical protein